MTEAEEWRGEVGLPCKVFLVGKGDVNSKPPNEGSMKTTTRPGCVKLRSSLWHCPSPLLLRWPAHAQVSSAWKPLQAKAGPWNWVIRAGQHPLLVGCTPGPKAEWHTNKPRRRPFIKIQGPETFNSLCALSHINWASTDVDPWLAKADTIIILSAQSRKRSFETLITSIAAFLGYPMIKKPQEKATPRLFLGHRIWFSPLLPLCDRFGFWEISSGSLTLNFGKSWVIEAGQIF